MRRAHGVARCSPKRRAPVWRRHAQGRGARAPVGGVHRNSHLAALEGPVRQPHPGAARNGGGPLLPLASAPSCCSLHNDLRGQGCSERPPSPRAAWFRAGLGARGCGSCADGPRPSAAKAARHESKALSRQHVHLPFPSTPPCPQFRSLPPGNPGDRSAGARPCARPGLLVLVGHLLPRGRAGSHLSVAFARCRARRSLPCRCLCRCAAAKTRTAAGACDRSSAAARLPARPYA